MPNPLDDDIDDDDLENDDTETQTPKGLRAAAARSNAHKAEAEAAKREIALLKAGIDTDTPLGAMFADAYKGELTKDAVTAAFKALGVTPAAAADADHADDTPDDSPDLTADLDSTDLRQALANGGAADIPVELDPRVKAQRDVDTVINAGGTQEDGLAAGIQTLLQAAVAGDKRVLIEHKG